MAPANLRSSEVPTHPLFASPIRLAGWLVLAVLLVYGNSLHAPFLFDDTGAVVNNATIERLGSWAILNPPADGSTTTGRPLVNASFAVNYALSERNVWSYHALNLSIHLLCALLLLGSVRRILSGPVLQSRFGFSATNLAFGSALIWTVHPLLTETVVCVAQRTESLCALFYLLTIYGFLRGVAEGGRLWWVVAWFACLAGMASKEVMVTAPVMVLLLDRTFFAGGFATAWRQRRGFYLALAGTWLLLGFLLWRGGGSRGLAAGFGLGISSWSYLLKQCEALVLYLQLSLWPHPLVLDYGTAVTHALGEVWWQGVIILALLAGTAWALARRPALGFVGAWFFIILSPSSSVVPLVTQTVAEHRMYLPLVSLIVLAVVGLHEIAGRRAGQVLIGLTLALGALTAARNRDYREVVTIWADNVAKYPRSERAENNLAWALQQQGRSAEANLHFARAVELQPGYVSARYNWGVALLDQKQTEAAIAQFEAAVRLAPAHADARLNLGNALMQVQRAAEAIPQYEEALRLKPGADVHYNLGIALAEVGRANEAEQHLRAALQGNPQLAEAHYQLGLLAETTQQWEEAERHYAATLRIAPDHRGAHRKLGLLLARDQRIEAAAVQFQWLVRLQPGDADAHANLGNVFLLQGKVREAITEYEEALRLKPDDPRLRENLQLAREALR
jgi:tetratricopeptide (TPR) repeat protein